MMINSIKKITLILLLLVSNIANADEAQIKKFINNGATNIINIVKNSETSDKIKSEKLGKVINNMFDTKWMAKFVLGREYKSLSKNQQTEYLNLYQKYLQNTYFPILMRYKDQSYSITKVIKTGKNLYDIDLKIEKTSDTPQLNLTYTLKENDEKYKLLDMSVEGVSTVFTQKSEFSSVLQNHGLDRLFSRLKATTNS